MAIFLLSVLSMVYTFEMDRQSSTYIPNYPTTNDELTTVGSYTLDNFSCQISFWLDGWENARTTKACSVGRVSRWVLVPLLALSLTVMVTTLLSMWAKRRATTRVLTRKEEVLSDSSSTRPSTYDHLRDGDEKAELESPVEGAQTCSSSSPQSATYAHQYRQPAMAEEKQGREVLEKDGWQRVELPA